MADETYLTDPKNPMESRERSDPDAGKPRPKPPKFLKKWPFERQAGKVLKAYFKD